MNEHLKVIETAIVRLYARIDGPTARDAMARRVSLKAVGAIRSAAGVVEEPEVTPPAPEAPEASGEPGGLLEQPITPPPLTPEALTRLEDFLANANQKVVREAVESGTISPVDALEFGVANKNRPKLVAWLEEQVNGALDG